MNIQTITLIVILLTIITVAAGMYAYILQQRLRELRTQAQRENSLAQQHAMHHQAELKLATVRLSELQQRVHELNAERVKQTEKFESQQQLLLQYREHLGKAQEKAVQLQQLKEKEQQQERLLQQLQQQYASLQRSYAELQTAAQKDREQMQEKQQLLMENSEQLKQQFSLLASEIFDAKQQQFSQSSQQQLNALLQPLKQQVENFRVRMEEVHSNSMSGNSQLFHELQRLKDLNQQVSAEAVNLTRALKGDKKLQGNWGEQKVELLLETCGLRAGIEYLREQNIRDDDGANKRPDFIVNLPQGKQLIIDSKVSLVHYAEAVASDDPQVVEQKLQQHVQSLRNHIAGLASKNYTALIGQKSPDFVMLFVAVEPAYFSAVERYPALFQEAYDKGITLVTASTLLPLLQVVANLWAMQQQNQNTRILAEQASRIYDKLRVFIEKMNRLGAQLQTAQRTYDDAFDTLSRGQGSLSKTVDKFVDLGVKVNRRLPENAIDTLEDE